MDLPLIVLKAVDEDVTGNVINYSLMNARNLSNATILDTIEINNKTGEIRQLREFLPGENFQLFGIATDSGLTF